VSAFYDLWIGNSLPGSYRSGNAGWLHSQLALQCFLSLPGNKTDFYSETDSDTHTLIVLGQFYEKINISTLLQQCAKYIANTDEIFYDPAGHYILFLFDKKSKYWYVFTNRLGTYHAYWLSEDGKNSISTYYLELARFAGTKELDWEGITGFLSMGFFPEDKTYLKTIKIFKPASCYCFNEQLQLVNYQRYWNWSHQPQEYSVNKHINKLNEVLIATLGEAIKGKRVALPISGGLDSRVLSGVTSQILHGDVSKLWSFSYGYSDTSVETIIAKQIANSRKIPFDNYVVPNYLFDKINTITESVELFQYVDGTRQAFMNEMLDRKSDVVIGGHWGDVWMDDMGIEDDASKNEDDTLLFAFRKKIIKKGSSWLMNEVCKPYIKDSEDYLNSYFTDYINKYKYIKDPDFRMKIFKTDQWSFRWTLASIRMYQAGAFPVLPFYDRRIVELFTTIKTSEVKKRYLEVEYIKAFHPDLAKIKWQEYNSNLYNYKFFSNRNIAYRVADKLKRSVVKNSVVRRNWEIFYLNPAGREHLEQELLNPKFSAIVSAGKIRQLINELYDAPSASNGYAISMLLTFSQFINKIM